MSSPAWLRRSLAPVALSVLAASLSVACGGGAPSSSAGAGEQPPSAGQSPGPAWKGVLGQVQPDGTVSLATALAAFTLSVGPLPGVTTPTGTAGQITDGTVGVRWVIAHWSELTPAQQAAVTTDLVAPAKAQALGGSQGGVELDRYVADPGSPRLLGVPSPSGYLATAQHFRTLIAADLGRDTPQDLKVVVNKTQQRGADALAYTASFDSGYGFTGKPAHCVIYINPLLYNGTNRSLVASAVAHEVFHCFQADDYPSMTAFGAAPSWLAEGQGEWVGETLEPTPDGSWDDYLTALSTVLFSRSYDAIGFYAHMAESGINPWSRLDAMLKVSGNAAAYAIAVNDTFRTNWASSLARRPSLGTGWDTTGPGITSATYTPTPTTLGNGSTVGKKVAPYTNAVVETNIVADAVSVTVTGKYARLRAADGTEYDAAELHDAKFCVTNCEQNSCVSALKRLVPGPTWLAVTGDASGASYTISGGQNACACVIGTWTVTNEVITALHASGGAGSKWTIGAGGLVRIDYSQSAPLSGNGVTVRYSGYAEYVDPQVTLDVSATSGTWRLRPLGGNVVVTTTAFGQTTTRSSPNGPGSFVANGTWTCQGDSMTTSYGYLASGQTVTLRRG